MVVTFRQDVPFDEAMRLEACQDPALQVSANRKAQIISEGVAVWMFVDGKLAGEVYGARASLSQDADISPYGDGALWCCGAAIFPEYRCWRLSKVMFAYWNALVWAAGFSKIVGHAAHPAMVATQAFFGATIIAERPNWGGSGHTAHLYEVSP